MVHKNGQHAGSLPGRLVRNPNRGKGVPEGFKFGELTKNMSMWFLQAKLETQQLAFRALLRVLGPKRLTNLGKYLNTAPLETPDYARL